MSASFPGRVGVKRLLLIAIFVLATTVVLVPSAGAGNFDEQRMGCSGENPATCTPGTVGKPYSLKIELLGDEDEACAVYSANPGLPPGLSISGEFITGTPTQAGNYDLFLEVEYTAQSTCPFKPASDDRFIFLINPEIPRLILQPEQTGVPSSTVGSAFSLQMTSNLPDAKTWALASGSLPPGLTLGATDGLITGTPTTAGAYPFTISAALSPDPLVTPPRSDTKALIITVRDPLAITADELFDATTKLARTELGVTFEALFSATGGSGTNTWSIAGGAAPPGLTLSPTGTITGRLTTTGRYGFTVSVADTEGRTATYAAVVSVAARLAISTLVLRSGKVLRPYRQKVATTGGVEPEIRVKQGPLPRGIRFDRTLGVLSGTPLKAGTWRIVFEAVDSLGVKSAKTLVLRVLRAKPASGG